MLAMRHLRRPVTTPARPTPSATPTALRPSRPCPHPPAASADPGPSASSSPDPTTSSTPALVGEDAAAFDLGAQSLGRWAFFGAELTIVMVLLWVVSVQV